jgi:hypothetical protein
MRYEGNENKKKMENGIEKVAQEVAQRNDFPPPGAAKPIALYPKNVIVFCTLGEN